MKTKTTKKVGILAKLALYIIACPAYIIGVTAIKMQAENYNIYWLDAIAGKFVWFVLPFLACAYAISRINAYRGFDDESSYQKRLGFFFLSIWGILAFAINISIALYVGFNHDNNLLLLTPPQIISIICCFFIARVITKKYSEHL